MKKRRILGTITIVAAIPSLLFIIFLISKYEVSFFNWIILEKISIILSCASGGALLWKGHKWGYRFSGIGWLILIFVSVTSILAALQPETSERLKAMMYAKDSLYLIIGVPAIYILVRDMIYSKRV